MLSLRRSKTYTLEEFFNNEHIEKKEKKINIKKEDLIKYTAIGVLALSGVAVYSKLSIPILNHITVMAMNSTVEVSALQEPAKAVGAAVGTGAIANLDGFILDSLNRLYAAICFSAFVVEAIQSRVSTEKQFESCIIKYGVSYSIGLLVLCVLYNIKKLGC